MHPRTRARLLALRALAQLESSQAPLNAILESLDAPPESLGFARELSSGTTRWRSRLDWTLAPLLSKPIEKLDAPVRAALRLALLERVVLGTPARAVANEYAGLMREAKLKSAVGFVNAIARRLPDAWRESPAREKNEAKHLATETAHPEWMVARWIKALGFEASSALCQANNGVAALDVRVNTARASREQVLAALRERGLDARAGALSPHNIRVLRVERSRAEAEEAPGEEESGARAPSLSPWRWPEWGAGLLIAQDEAAQLVALALDAGAGERILDVASAPGGKATHLAQIAGEGTRIVAADRSGERLEKVRENSKRLQLENVEFFEGSAQQVLAAIERGEVQAFDKVLLDAPCSGTGTLRRRPDAKWRKSPENLRQLVELQGELLDVAAGCVRDGGVLCYSTCSVEEEENQGAIRAFLERHPDWNLVPPSERLVSSRAWNGLSAGADLPGAIATVPGRNECDGMFCALLRRGSSVGS